MMRTSESHPLHIDAIPVGAGAIGLTMCPGKQGASLYGEPWARDLTADVDVIRAWGATCVLTLIEASEFRHLKVEGLGEAIAAAGMAWLWMPIVDGGVLDAAGEARWRELGPALLARLKKGEKIVIHCRGGLGRAGSIAASLLMMTGSSADEAIATVRHYRRGAIETRAQEIWLHDVDKRRA